MSSLIALQIVASSARPSLQSPTAGGHVFTSFWWDLARCKVLAELESCQWVDLGSFGLDG